jgi:hypothetical protein
MPKRRYPQSPVLELVRKFAEWPPILMFLGLLGLALLAALAQYPVPNQMPPSLGGLLFVLIVLAGVACSGRLPARAGGRSPHNTDHKQT